MGRSNLERQRHNNRLSWWKKRITWYLQGVGGRKEKPFFLASVSFRLAQLSSETQPIPCWTLSYKIKHSSFIFLYL